MPAQNGLVEDNPTVLPETKVDEQELITERDMAKFSRTKEFEALESHLKERITFYQSFLPDGRPITEAPTIENWTIANAIIGEFNAVLAAYELARKTVEDHDGQRTRA